MAQAPAAPLALSPDQHAALRSLAMSTRPERVRRQARALLLAAEGEANAAIAARLKVARSTVLAWRARFADDGVAGVGAVRPGRGRKPQRAA